MIKKEIVKYYYVLEKEDLEKVVSKFFGREILLGDMKVEFADCVDVETGVAEDIYIAIEVDGEPDFFDFRYEYKEKGFNICEDLGIEEVEFFSWLNPFPDESDVFAFDIAEFKSYERYSDTSD